MELLKIVNKGKTYQGKDGKAYYDKKYYLVIDSSPTNKVFIAIEPVFTKDRRDFDRLDMFARLVVKPAENAKNAETAPTPANKEETPF